jgi:sec-independent protein translocase protein TatB
MFNFGWGELLLIGIVALIAIGPKELPTVLRTVGQALGKVRRMANEFQGQFQEALREADIADLKKQADDLTSSFKEQVTDISDFDPMADTQKEIENSLDFDAPAKTSDSAGETPPAQLAAPALEIDVPLPDAPAAVTEKDFAESEPKPAEKPAEKSAEKPAKKTAKKKAPKQAGSDA